MAMQKLPTIYEGDYNTGKRRKQQQSDRQNDAVRRVIKNNNLYTRGNSSSSSPYTNQRLFSKHHRMTATDGEKEGKVKEFAIEEMENRESSEKVSTAIEDDEEDREQLVKDILMLDEQENESLVMDAYDKNRLLFLMHSVLLGMSYSIVWPTLWQYVESFELAHNYALLLYGVMYVAYPICSTFSAKLVERSTLSGKRTILLLNFCEVVGHLLYMLNFVPFLPLLGRMVAGLGDAFYVVLMTYLKSNLTPLSNECMTKECLASFIFGIIVSPGVNIVTTYLHFRVGSLTVNENNFPGLTMAVLFIVMQIIHYTRLHDDSLVKPNEDVTLKKKMALISKFPEEENTPQQRYTARISVAVLAGYSFLYTYVVATFEVLTPLIIYERLQSGHRGAMLCYAIVGVLYAMILVATMSVTLKRQFEVFLAICSLAMLFGTVGVYYIIMTSATDDVYTVLAFIFVVLSLPTLWANDDVLFVTLIQARVTRRMRDQTYAARKLVSKIAFFVAGITSPFLSLPSVLTVCAPVILTLILLGMLAHIILHTLERFNSSSIPT